MPDDVILPTDTLLRMALISEKHLQGEYNYLRVIVASHERELMWLSLGVVTLSIINYALLIKLYRMEKGNAATGTE